MRGHRTISRAVIFSILAVLALITVDCAQRKTVKRIDTEEIIDLSGRWNDTDSRLVSEEMINDCLNRPWIGQFVQDEGEQPTVIVGTIYNRTQEHIATGTFVKDLEQAFVNSGLVQVVAGVMEREEVRDEREDQQYYATEETRSELQAETGADFMLSGTIESIADQEGGEKVIYYQVNLQLLDLETNVKTWIGDKKIKKYIKHAGTKL
jgi:uncharacterized protein (TIGR02722 family)